MLVLKGNSPTAAPAFKDDLSVKLPGVLPLEVWDREDLLRKFLAHPPGLHGALLPSDFADHGACFGCYGHALDGRLSADGLELHSRSLLDWADRIHAEPEEHSVAALDPRAAVLVSLLLRACYFPRLWPQVLAATRGGDELDE